jgi:hypothetical protein
LSFDHAGRTYLFDLRAEWLDRLDELRAEIEAALDSGEEGPPLYSNK